MKALDDLGDFTMAIILQAASSQGDWVEGALLGRVQLAGKVIEHADGYRAERAHIAELIPTTTDAGITLTLASRLGLPLGAVLDTSPVLREMEEFRASQTNKPWRPGPLDRLRLRRHSRHFRLIQGTRDD